MNTLPKLVSALPEVDGREKKTIEHIGRLIREAGFLPKGKSGAGAPIMTSKEVANLIIALNGTNNPKDAPIEISRFRSLKQYFQGNARTMIEDFYDPKGDYPKPISLAMESKTFGLALEAVVDGVPELYQHFFDQCGKYTPEFDQHKICQVGYQTGLFGLEIIFEKYHCSIGLYSGLSGYAMRKYDCRIKFKVDEDLLEEGHYSMGDERIDRKVSVEIGFATLVAAWQAINPNKELFPND